MSKNILIAILFLLFQFAAEAQMTSFDFPAMRWRTHHGLKSGSLHNIAMDSKGIIWVSTIEGLYRHHGNRFENINTIVENSLFDNPVEPYALYIDNQDRLWIGSWRNGLIMYDINKNVVTQFEALINGKDHLSNLRIYGLHTINDSIFRFNSHTHGLIDYNINQEKFKVLEVFTDSTALAELDGFQLMMEPLQDANSEVVVNWYAALTGMVEYDSKLDSFIYYDDGEHIRIRDAVMGTDSIVWAVTYGQGLFSFDMKEKEFINHLCAQGGEWSHQCLSGGSVEIYNDSTIILDTNDRLYFYHKNTQTFERFNDISPFTNWSGKTSEMKWINGELWQASASSTLYRHYKDDHGVQSVSAEYNIDEVYYDSKRKRYISNTKPNRLTIHRENDFEEIKIPKSYLNDDSYVEGVTTDFDDNLWIATSNQVLLYDEIKKTYKLPFKTILNSIKTDLTFRHIKTSPNGSIWLSSHDGTIFTFDPKTLDYKLYGNNIEESIRIEHSYRSRLEGFSEDGYAWFLAQNGFFGLSPDDDNHKFPIGLKDSKTNKPITILSPLVGVGPNSKICFGAKTHEVYVVHSDSLIGGFAHLIDLSKYIPNIIINDIEIDSKGIIWIATKMGIIQIDQENDNIEFYGDTHRLFDLEELEIQDGIYPIATSYNDFLIIRPEELTPFQGTPNIQLLNVELDSKEIKSEDGSFLATGEQINLGPTDNFLRIQFNDFNYVSQRPKTYAIKVEGLHDDWIDLNERNEYGFSGLPGGLSNILIKSKLQFSKEYSEPVILLSVNVTPPLTKRKSFWALCAGLLMLLFYLGYRYRLSQLKEKQNLMIAFNKQLAETEMKALRAQMNPHFLFNVLNAIKLNVQKNEQENAIDFITDFSKLIRSVLQNSGKQRIPLAEELQTLELYIKIERKRFSTSFDYEFTLDESLNLEQTTIPPMLLQPYVENAIWHGILHRTEGNGLIRINTFKSKNSIVVEIIDNGIGREKANKLKLKSAQKNKSMGMQITQDRMAMSNIISSDHIKVSIIDLYNEGGQAAGTKVIIELQQGI